MSKKQLTMKRIVMSKLDYARILKCIQDGKDKKTINSTEAENLLNELHAARLLNPSRYLLISLQ